MKKTYFFTACIVLVLLLNTHTLFAQAPLWNWSYAYGRLEDSQGQAIASDNAGNIYTGGMFDDTAVTFGAYTVSNISSNGNDGDLFLVKQDNLGTVLWAKRAGGNNDDFIESIATDPSGNVYITGYFQSTTIIFGSTTLTNAGFRDYYLAKYDPAGNVIWAKRGGGTGEERGTSVTTDAAGNCYVTGYFFSSITFGSTTLTPIGSGDIFLVKYDSAGNVLWAKKAGGSDAADVSKAVKVDAAGNVYIAGHFSSTSITFGTTTFINADNSTFFGDLFLVKYDALGNVVWAKNATGSPDGDGFIDLGLDAAGNIYGIGYLSLTTIILDSATAWINITAGNSTFIVKYDPNGNVLWARDPSVLGAHEVLGNSIYTNAAGDCYITGGFRGTVNFGFSTLTSNAASSGIYDVFVVKYDASGNVYWAVQNTGGIGDDQAHGIAVDAAGNSYITGYFKSNSISFGTTTLINANTNLSSDIFVTKLDNTGAVVTGITSAAPINLVAVYPNPSSGKFRIELKENSSSPVTIEICNVLGEIIYKSQVAASEIDLTGNAKGIYFYRITNASGIIGEGKMIIE